jgi:pimeloyl-ACP methyl ester carboxylesterase
MAEEGRNGPPALLVHGLWVGSWSMSWLAHALRERGFDARTHSYESVTGSLEQHLARLGDGVALLAHGGRKVNLVGHSMGGVVILRYLLGNTRDSAPPAAIGRVVLLGTPARGSQAALAFERQPWGHLLLGESLPLWRSEFQHALDSGLEVGAIAGSQPFGLGPLFVSLPPPSDGVVTVEETRIEGLRDHRVLGVSHTGMLFSGEVAENAAAFLATGAFKP